MPAVYKEDAKKKRTPSMLSTQSAVTKPQMLLMKVQEEEVKERIIFKIQEDRNDTIAMLKNHLQQLEHISSVDDLRTRSIKLSEY